MSISEISHVTYPDIISGYKSETGDQTLVFVGSLASGAIPWCILMVNPLGRAILSRFNQATRWGDSTWLWGQISKSLSLFLSVCEEGFKVATGSFDPAISIASWQKSAAHHAWLYNINLNTWKYHQQLWIWPIPPRWIARDSKWWCVNIVCQL